MDYVGYLEKLKAFSVCSHVASTHISASENFPSTAFPQKFSPKKVWSKISYGDESTSCQTSSYFSGQENFSSASWKYQRLPIWYNFI